MRMVETESQRKARKLLHELREIRQKGSYEDRVRLLQGLGGTNEIRGTSSREVDSLSPLLSKLQARRVEAVRTITSTYAACRQELGYNATSEKMRDEMLEKLNSLTLPSVEVRQEIQRVNEMAWKSSPKSFLAWLREEYVD